MAKKGHKWLWSSSNQNCHVLLAGGSLVRAVFEGGGTSPLFSGPGGVRPPFFRARSARKKGTFGAKGAFLENFYDFSKNLLTKKR